MELLLIRHGLPVRVDGTHADGPADPSLGDEGRAQAAALADWWSAHGVDAVWSSPMARAVETAAPLAAAIGVDVRTDPDLREYDASSAQYVPLEELRRDEALWAKVVAEWSTPEAEAMRQEFRAGVVTAIGRVVAAHPGQRVVVVCHGVVINAYVSHVLGLPQTMFFEPAYTSVSRVLAGQGVGRLVSLNERPHIAALAVPTAF